MTTSASSSPPARTAPNAAADWFRATPVFLAFLAMGFGDATGPFVSLAKQQFHLSTFSAQFIAFTGFIMFGLLSVPMGVFQGKVGKATVLRLGLAIMLCGVLLPAVGGLGSYPLFLLAVLLLGAGATTLQVAGNPLMRDVSAAGMYSRNLSLGQFVKAIGSLSGPLIPVLAARYWGLSWHVIFPIFSVALALTLAASFGLRRAPRAAAAADAPPTTLASCLKLLGNGYVAAMVLGIFLYVGAEVCMSSNIPLYLQQHFHVNLTRTGLLGTGLFFAALTLGRFSGGVILNWMKPPRFFLLTCLVSLIGFAGVLMPSPLEAAAGFFLAGLGFANIFPLVFSIAIDAMPEASNELAGLMVTAIVGAAFLPPLMGWVADRVHSMQAGFLVPLAAIGYLTWLAASRHLRPKRTA